MDVFKLIWNEAEYPRDCLKILKENENGYWKVIGSVKKNQKFLLYSTKTSYITGIIGFGVFTNDGPRFLDKKYDLPDIEKFKLNLVKNFEKAKFAEIAITYLNLDTPLVDEDKISKIFGHLTDFVRQGSKTIDHKLQTQAHELYNRLSAEYDCKKIKKDLETVERVLTETDVETETKREVIQRVGQEWLRKELLELHHGMCQVSGEARQDLLVCSHIVPWKDDKDNRLNPDNALLLAFNYDFLFDKGYITFENDGKIKISERVDNHFGISEHDRLREKELTEETKKFLEYHRTHIFKK